MGHFSWFPTLQPSSITSFGNPMVGTCRLDLFTLDGEQRVSYGMDRYDSDFTARSYKNPKSNCCWRICERGEFWGYITQSNNESREIFETHGQTLQSPFTVELIV